MDETRSTFAAWLHDQARGTLDDEATAAMAEVVQQVTDLNKKGSVVVEVTVEPTGNSGRMIAIAGKVTKKLPKADPEASVFFADENGALHRHDPYQDRLPARGMTTDEETSA